jgi:transposase, IS6 family
MRRLATSPRVARQLKATVPRAPTFLAVVVELMPAAFHNTAQHANNRIEADHGRLKARLRPMRGLKRNHSARAIMR